MTLVLYNMAVKALNFLSVFMHVLMFYLHINAIWKHAVLVYTYVVPVAAKA